MKEKNILFGFIKKIISNFEPTIYYPLVEIYNTKVLGKALVSWRDEKSFVDLKSNFSLFPKWSHNFS